MTYLASSAGALIVDRNSWHTSSDTWQGRANQAWGSSRVWNSGTSWEVAYGSSQTSLAAMTADRDTWTSRANQAWGVTRVWNSGESWEQAYNRVLPPATTIKISNNQSVNGDGVYRTNLAPITFDRTGYWVVIWKCGQGGLNMEGYVNGTQVFTNLAGTIANAPMGTEWSGLASAGQQAWGAVNASGGSFRTIYVDAYFIPRQSNPH